VPSHTITIRNEADRAKVMSWLKGCAYGFWVEVREPKRSDPQNKRMWALLADVARQGQIGGRKFNAEAWKCIFMKAMGKEVDFLPTLDGQSFFPSGFRSSELSVKDMADMQTFIEAWACEQGIVLKHMEGMMNDR